MVERKINQVWSSPNKQPRKRRALQKERDAIAFLLQHVPTSVNKTLLYGPAHSPERSSLKRVPITSLARSVVARLKFKSEAASQDDRRGFTRDLNTIPSDEVRRYRSLSHVEDSLSAALRKDPPLLQRAAT